MISVICLGLRMHQFQKWCLLGVPTPCWSVLDFWKLNLEKSSSMNWIFTACVACKNQIQNWFLQVKNPVRPTWFFKLDFSQVKYKWIGRKVSWCHDGSSGLALIDYQFLGIISQEMTLHEHPWVLISTESFLFLPFWLSSEQPGIWRGSYVFNTDNKWALASWA